MKKVKKMFFLSFFFKKFFLLDTIRAFIIKNNDKPKFITKLKELKRKNQKSDPILEDRILVIGNYKIFSLKSAKDLKVFFFLIPP